MLFCSRFTGRNLAARLACGRFLRFACTRFIAGILSAIRLCRSTDLPRITCPAGAKPVCFRRNLYQRDEVSFSVDLKLTSSDLHPPAVEEQDAMDTLGETGEGALVARSKANSRAATETRRHRRTLR